MNETHMQTMARLVSVLAMQEARIKADPLPYLKRASAEIVQCMKLIENLHYALSPDSVFDMADKMEIKPIDFQGEALVRCNAALDVLNKFSRT